MHTASRDRDVPRRLLMAWLPTPSPSDWHLALRQRGSTEQGRSGRSHAKNDHEHASRTPTIVRPRGTGVSPPFGLPTVVARGVAAGVVADRHGRLVHAVDASMGSPFRTPNFCRSLLGLGSGLQMGVGPILLYTLSITACGSRSALLQPVLQHVENASPSCGDGARLPCSSTWSSTQSRGRGVNVVQALRLARCARGQPAHGMRLMAICTGAGPTRRSTWGRRSARTRSARRIVCGLIRATVSRSGSSVFDVLRGKPSSTPAALARRSPRREHGRGRERRGGHRDRLHRHAPDRVRRERLSSRPRSSRGGRPTLRSSRARSCSSPCSSVLHGAARHGRRVPARSLAWWTIAVGNVPAAVVMGWYLWMHHPKCEPRSRWIRWMRTD